MYKVSGNAQRPTIVIDLENGLFELSGSSIPENPFEVFEPVLDHLKLYLENPHSNTSLNLKLDYFNTSTSKILLDIIDNLADLQQNQQSDVAVRWFYREGDDDMMEIGEDFANLSRIPIEVVPYSTRN